jgi:hypothetical protein
MSMGFAFLSQKTTLSCREDYRIREKGERLHFVDVLADRDVVARAAFCRRLITLRRWRAR